MRYYLVAGEASGDLHGANLMKALLEEDPDAEFRYFGGDKMENAGGTLAKHYAEMAFMGFTEVIFNLRTILRNMKACKVDLLSYQPDVLILIDFPGFNLKIAEFAKQQGIKVCYYISPKVWAWNQKRVLKIKKIVDKMFCILPFEVEFYQKWGMKVDYVGNPLLDELSNFQPDPDFCGRHGLDGQKIVALLPGSRKQEIEKLLPEMLEAAERLPDFCFVIAAAPGFGPEYYARFIKGGNTRLVFGKTYDLLHIAAAAIVASGTATLETALFKVPQVVVYKGGAISVAIARMLVRIKFISLVNLILDKPAVKELIQKECNAPNILTNLEPLLRGQSLERDALLHDYDSLENKMGTAGASERTAKLIVPFAKV